MQNSPLFLAILAGCFLVDFGAERVCQAQQPVMVNKSTTHYWVARRHPNDPNIRGDIAVVLKISSISGQVVSGEIYVYNGVDGAKYKPRPGYPRALAGTVTGNDVGGNTRAREKCHLTQVSGDPLDVYVSLFKGKDKSAGQGRAHQRMIVRYKPGGAKQSALPARSDFQFVSLIELQDPCDEEPNEDVLEEEPNINPNDLPTLP